VIIGRHRWLAAGIKSPPAIGEKSQASPQISSHAIRILPGVEYLINFYLFISYSPRNKVR